MNKFESALKNKIESINRKIYENNLNNLMEFAIVCKKKLSKDDLLQVKNDLINRADSLFIKSEIDQIFN